MYHFKAVAADHWLEILVVGIALIFVLLQIPGRDSWCVFLIYIIQNK